MHIMGRQDAINTTIRSLIYFHSLGVLKLVVCKKKYIEASILMSIVFMNIKAFENGFYFLERW